MKKILLFIIVFLIWRIALFVTGYFGDYFILYAPSFPYADGLLDSFSLPRWLYSWANFDGVHYLTLAQKGYHGADLIQAFFPVYPLLTRFLTLLTQNALLSSLLVSHVSFLLLLIVWHSFITKYFSKSIAYYSTIAMLWFPTSLYFVATYTESLFLLFVILAFWASREKKYWLTALCVGFASATRVTGILLLPALFFDVIFNDQTIATLINKWRKIGIHRLTTWKQYTQPFFILFFGSAGLFVYMYYLYIEFGDAFYFFHVQAEFGGGVRQESFISFPQVVWRYIKILATARPFDLKYFSYVQEFVVGVLGLFGIVLAATKIRASNIVFALLAFFLPTLTGTFSSMPRYVLICFPIFILIGIWAEKKTFFRYTWFVISGILLALNTILFVQGYWVA